MSIQFLRGNSQTPRGHAILVAHSMADPRTIFFTYCIVTPMPLSMGKYLPAFLAAQLPPEEMREAASVSVVPIPPMLEEAGSLEHLQMLAERREDDLIDIGSINPKDEMARMQQAVEKCQEYGQLYLNYASSFAETPFISEVESEDSLPPLDDLDTEELLMQTMSDRQRLTELGKLIGTARYALEGHDSRELQETKRRMQRIAGPLPEKYRSSELLTAAFDPGERGARLAQLYLERGFKLVDEEYAEIPGIERAIREFREE
jgi:hypothetical protein